MRRRLSQRASLVIFGVFVALLAEPGLTAGTDTGWPREIEVSQAKIVIYQPQVETFQDDRLSGRAAVSVQTKEIEEPAFGAVWITSRVETDRDARMVDVLDISVPRVRFPESTPEQEAQLSQILETEMPKWDLSLSLDRLLASLEEIDKERMARESLGTVPPRIIFSTRPSMLIMIDGEPKLSKVEDTKLMRVVNTPFLIVFDPPAKRYYLYAGQKAWYRAPELESGWEFVEQVPSAVAKLAPDESEIELPDPDEEDARTIPEIVVVTEPAELIYTNGEPEYTPLANSELMYVSNSDSDLFLEIETQKLFVVLSGRWYTGESLEGPWSYVPSDQLPASFADIPADSEVGDVRAFVAGTEEATEAALDVQIPQTAKVKRGVAELEVTYDGDPQFEKIEGTQLEYAINTPYAVIKDGEKYFVCDAGVWYVADGPNGPWTVATERPEGVENIPPDCPVYNVKYVYIFETTPEVVYVGYTPSYTGTYVYNTTIVYGTGFWYPGWYGSVYYPRPATWGFHVRWNPWTGWSFGLTYSNGWFTFGIGLGGWNRWYGGWWGPGLYHGYWRGYHRGYYHGWNRGYYHGAHAGYRAGLRAGIHEGYRQGNLYNDFKRPGVSSPERRPGGAAATPQARPGNQPRSTRDRKNDVYTDRNGNVYQRNRDGSWEGLATQDRQARDRSGSTRDRASQPWDSSGMDRGTRNQLNRDYNARQRGTQRSNQFQRSRSVGGRAGPRGMGRRGR